MFIQGEASSTLPKNREGGRGQTKHQPSATAQGNPGGMQLQTIQTCSPPVTFRAIAHRSASSTQKVVANHKNGTSEPRVLQKLYIPKTRIMKRGSHQIPLRCSQANTLVVCFAHFDLEMCSAPQRRALFQHHLNFQKWSETVSF